MEEKLSVEETTQRLYMKLAEAIGWKYLKSKRCLKKCMHDLVFQIDFHSSKWNCSYQSVEVNAEFVLWCKSYGKVRCNNVIAHMSYQPDGGYWYDISDEGKLTAVFEELRTKIQNTAVCLYTEFEKDVLVATEGLLRDHFDSYNVQLDFVADKLGRSAIKEKAHEIYESLSDQMKQQVVEYRNGSRDKAWMINRGNLKYIVDNDLIEKE